MCTTTVCKAELVLYLPTCAFIVANGLSLSRAMVRSVESRQGEVGWCVRPGMLLYVERLGRRRQRAAGVRRQRQHCMSSLERERISLPPLLALADHEWLDLVLEAAHIPPRVNRDDDRERDVYVVDDTRRL
jgi:hypothetical protein